MEPEKLLEHADSSGNIEEIISRIEQNTESLRLNKTSSISTGRTTYAEYLIFEPDQEYEIKVSKLEDNVYTEFKTV